MGAQPRKRYPSSPTPRGCPVEAGDVVVGWRNGRAKEPKGPGIVRSGCTRRFLERREHHENRGSLAAGR